MTVENAASKSKCLSWDRDCDPEYKERADEWDTAVDLF